MNESAIFLEQAVFKDMIADVRRREPMEAVGILAGRTISSISRCIPLPNISSKLHAYWADPFAQWQALQALSDEGMVPVAVYHSHPGGGIGLSLADLSFAIDLGLYQIVVAIQGDNVRVAAYIIEKSGVANPIGLSVTC